MALGANVEELVDVDGLRNEVREKYKEVAQDPHADFHFHTGREHALRMGYPTSPLDELPDEATDAFAGVGNPFYWEHPQPGDNVIDLGSGAGMDSFLAALWVGPEGCVVGVDMTEEMVQRARATARGLGLDNVEFRSGVIEELPVESEWADVVISNGVINLCPDKLRLQGDPPGAETRWTNDHRRHLCRATGARERAQGHRSLDRLNCWCPAVRRVGDGDNWSGNG